MRALGLPVRGLCGCVLTLSLAATARAAEPVGERFPDDKPPLALLPASEDALMDPRMARSWGTLPPRPFIATTVDVGFVYLRPRLSLGYGRPFTQWVGVDANPIAAQNGLGAYAGLRLEVPHLDFRIGPRYFASFNHTYLPPQANYSRLDLESNTGDPSRTLTFEAELDLNFDLGPGRLLLRGSGSYVSGVPEGYNAFEETLHIIVEPPLVWRARLAYSFSFGARKQHGIGAAVDLLEVPKRDESRTIRIGPVVRLALSRRVDVRGSFIFSVVSPDRIGLAGGDFTELGIRYRWASE
ncbi:MAG TPA: hypothetical protein VER12_15640 [Polyangiaceae bacterium]|nr:hypothetical protein [Polyangiaceae bacterium]HYQ26039.1 hypothetical protein [Polyangiaceae bacterium]